MTTWLIRCFALLLLVLPFAPVVADDPDDKEIARLVKQLGSTDYRTRDAAAKRLQEIGEPALSALHKATTSDDGEVLRRAEEIATAIEAPWKELKKLRKERLATLTDLVTLAEKEAYHAGKASYEEVRQASRLLREAELEQCASDKERLVLHERALARAKNYEKITHMRLQAGVQGGTLTSVLAARADRLASEIAIEQAKAKAAKAPDPKSAQAADVPADLLKAQVASARKVYELNLKTYQAGAQKYDLESLYLWSVRWLNAERDLSETPADRVAAVEAHLERMKAVEAIANQLAKLEAAGVRHAAAAEFYRAQAQIWVSKAKSK